MDVATYERLFEASFGKLGFYSVSAAMFIMAYGAMVSYLIIIKDTLPTLVGFGPEDYFEKRVVVTLSSLFIILPLSCQRDMADLAKTSSLSVLFDIIMVALVVICSPISSYVSSSGGMIPVISRSIIKPSTLFIGLGVFAFAFSCQHSAFLIATSLDRPTKKRWGIVTRSALTVCCVLASLIGIAGYLAFGEATSGNILNNFGANHDPLTMMAISSARGLLCTTMFFVYPLESFVARHVTVVTLFEGRMAHEGDDHSVLARWDRRIGLTTALYLSALIPALIFEDLGVVLSVTGSLGGSFLCYLGPGLTYLGVHGETFISLANSLKESNTFLWYVLLMPIWCSIAQSGQNGIIAFGEKEASKSPRLNRLGKIKHHKPNIVNRYIQAQYMKVLPHDFPGERLIKVRSSSFSADVPITIESNSSLSDMARPISNSINLELYGATAKGSTNRIIAAAISSRNKECQDNIIDEEDDPQDETPVWSDFFIAIFLINFGLLCMIAGLVSCGYQ